MNPSTKGMCTCSGEMQLHRIASRINDLLGEALRSLLINLEDPHRGYGSAGLVCPSNLSHKLAGPVFTIEGRRDDTIDAHDSLLKCCELLSKAPANVVLICHPIDDSLAHMGELSSETLAYKNELGYILDGGCRGCGLSKN
jgi:regulator of RNase E activity RraA